MSVSEQPSRIERLLDRARPARRKRGADQEQAAADYLAEYLPPTPVRAGRQPYDTGRTA